MTLFHKVHLCYKVEMYFNILKRFILEGMNHAPWSCKGKIRSRVGEGEGSLSDYKRMHWIVCKTQQREEEIEIFSRELERGKWAANFWHGFQGRLGTFPKGEICV